MEGSSKEYYQSWANYYVKFIKEYEKKRNTSLGINRTKRTNGYSNLGILYLHCRRRSRFLGKNLGNLPFEKMVIKTKSNYLGSNRDLIYQRATTTLADQSANKYSK